MYEVGELLCSMDCPFPQAEAWPSSAAEQCTARSSRHHAPAPASSPRPPLGTDALLGKAPTARSGSGIEDPSPARGEMTRPTTTSSTHTKDANRQLRGVVQWLPGSGGTERIGPEMVMAMSLSAPPHLPDPMLHCLSRKAGHNAQIIND